MNREMLLGAVTDRLEQALKEDDPHAVLDPRAVQDAEALMELVGAAAVAGRPLDLEAVRAVAWLHWLRYRVLPQEENRADLHAAIGLFARVFTVDPGSVPELLHGVYLTTG